MTTIPASSDTSTVSGAIDTYAPNAMVDAAMRLGALLEGGSLGAGPWHVNYGTPTDPEHSVGPFQINLDAHNDITQGRAEDPAGAVQYMLPAYEGALRKVPLSLWKSDPESAAEQTAFLAERPARDYLETAGQAGVDAKWQLATGVPPTSPASSGGGNPSIWSQAWNSFTSSAKHDLNAVKDLAHGNVLGAAGQLVDASAGGVVGDLLGHPDWTKALYYGAAVIAGGALIVAGLWKSVSHTQTAQTVSSALPAAAMAAAA